MSCLHCNTKYGLFNKEIGCGNCGMSFCHKCLKHKYKIPGNDKQSRICATCFTKLSQGIKTDPQTRPPPDIFLKRLASLENPAAPPITVYKHDKKIDALRRGLTPADQELVDRLERLKDEDKPPPTEEEIRERLRHLKGEITKPIVYDPKAVDLRSEQEQIDSLLEQYSNEAKIKEEFDPAKDLEDRIARLKGERAIKKKQKMDIDEDETSEEETERIARKAMARVALEAKCGQSSVEEEDNKSLRGKKYEKDDIVKFEEKLNEEQPELPWCVLCNDDAQYRCLDCGGDLYCTRCSREAHKEWGEEDHQIIKYVKK